MKLKDKAIQPPIADLPASYLEWWDIGDGYEIYVNKGPNFCSLGIHAPDKTSITYEIASLLGIDTSDKTLVKRTHDGEELYVSMGIDCVVLNYKQPGNYKQLMEKIEVIVNEKFKRK